MHITVAIIPPARILDDVEAALARTPAPPGEFAPVSRGSLMIPVFPLGSIARPEASAVADLLRDHLDAGLPAPRVSLAGVWALETKGSSTVALPLAGEVDQVNALARTLWDLVAMRGYYVDRRRWAPRLTIGSVTATTTLGFLERLVADLGAHSSPPWSVSSVAFVRRRFDSQDPGAWALVEEIATGAEVA